MISWAALWCFTAHQAAKLHRLSHRSSKDESFGQFSLGSIELPEVLDWM